jgi:hypothetical protein
MIATVGDPSGKGNGLSDMSGGDLTTGMRTIHKRKLGINFLTFTVKMIQCLYILGLPTAPVLIKDGHIL